MRALWQGRRGLVAVFGVALGVTLAVQPGHALAQAARSAPDGQSLDTQSQRTRQVFEAMYAPTCAAQEWIWQHTLALDTSMLEGPVASDGQQLEDQDDDVQLAFVAVWGMAAPSEWVAEHNAIVAHRVLPAPVAPIACPAARPSHGLKIGRAHV